VEGALMEDRFEIRGVEFGEIGGVELNLKGGRRGPFGEIGGVELNLKGGRRGPFGPPSPPPPCCRVRRVCIFYSIFLLKKNIV
jgi:hypothetical protein